LLANAIAKNNNIKGITINNLEMQQTLYADDASFFFEFCPNSFKALIETIDSF